MVAVPHPGRIAVRGLTKNYGPARVVDRLEFTVEPGTVTGFLGPNGAGKTTTLRMLLGLVRPDAGTATIGGHRYLDLLAPATEVGAVLEATGFHPARTGRAHLRVYCTVNHWPYRRADEVLDLVGLSGSGSRRVGGYSQGMRQRLALAAALLGDPVVLILDEPANGLDPEGIAWLRRLLRERAAAGGTVLVSSHVLTEMQHLADDLVIIDRGRLVHQGRLEELAGGRAGAVTVRTPQPDTLRAALDRIGARVETAGQDQLRVSGMDAAAVGDIAHDAGVRLHGLTAESGDLEQVFLALTGAGRGDQR